MESGNLSDNSPPSDLLRRLTPTLLSLSILICKRRIIPTLLTSQGCCEDQIQKCGGRCLVHALPPEPPGKPILYHSNFQNLHNNVIPTSWASENLGLSRLKTL